MLNTEVYSLASLPKLVFNVLGSLAALIVRSSNRSNFLLYVFNLLLILWIVCSKKYMTWSCCLLLTSRTILFSLCNYYTSFVCSALKSHYLNCYAGLHWWTVLNINASRRNVLFFSIKNVTFYYEWVWYRFFRQKKVFIKFSSSHTKLTLFVLFLLSEISYYPWI